MPYSFTAIDFETAQGKRHSICQVGLVYIENGIVTKKINKLVCPPDNYYHPMNISIHGITPQQTCNAPVFSLVWEEIRRFIENKTVVAHNGSFDFSCLRKTLEFYGISEPKYEPKCTLKIYRKNLAELCREYKIALNHHDALSDAMACAELYRRYLQQNGQGNL